MDRLEHVKTFLSSLKFVEQVTVRLLDVDNFDYEPYESFTRVLKRVGSVRLLEGVHFYRNPSEYFTSILQSMTLVRGLSINGRSNYNRVSRIKRWTGEWTSFEERAHELDKKEARESEFSKMRDDANLCSVELGKMDRENMRKLRTVRRVLAKADVQRRTEELTQLLSDLFSYR